VRANLQIFPSSFSFSLTLLHLFFSPFLLSVLYDRSSSKMSNPQMELSSMENDYQLKLKNLTFSNYILKIW